MIIQLKCQPKLVKNDIVCVAWRFLSNLRALRNRRSRDHEHQSRVNERRCREEPGRETTETSFAALCQATQADATKSSENCGKTKLAARFIGM